MIDICGVIVSDLNSCISWWNELAGDGNNFFLIMVLLLEGGECFAYVLVVEGLRS